MDLHRIAPAAAPTPQPTYAALRKAAEAAMHQGYEAIAYENAIEGEIGYALLRAEPDSDGDGPERLFWLPYGALHHDITYVEQSQMAMLPDVLANYTGPRAVRWHDPKRQVVGFVHYEKAGWATAVQIPMLTFKQASLAGLKVQGKDLCVWRDTLPSLATLVGVGDRR